MLKFHTTNAGETNNVDMWGNSTTIATTAPPQQHVRGPTNPQQQPQPPRHSYSRHSTSLAAAGPSGVHHQLQVSAHNTQLSTSQQFLLGGTTFGFLGGHAATAAKNDNETSAACAKNTEGGTDSSTHLSSSLSSSPFLKKLPPIKQWIDIDAHVCALLFAHCNPEDRAKLAFLCLSCVDHSRTQMSARTTTAIGNLSQFQTQQHQQLFASLPPSTQELYITALDGYSEDHQRLIQSIATQQQQQPLFLSSNNNSTNTTTTTQQRHYSATTWASKTIGQKDLLLCTEILQYSAGAELHKLGIHSTKELLITAAADRPYLERQLLRTSPLQRMFTAAVLNDLVQMIAAGTLNTCEDSNHATASTAQTQSATVTQMLQSTFLSSTKSLLSANQSTTQQNPSSTKYAPTCQSTTANEFISTGCVQLDRRLGGGWRVGGAITCVAGEAGSGKTQLALQALLACVCEDWSSQTVACYIVAEDFPSRRLLSLAEVWAGQLGITAAEILQRILVKPVKCVEHFHTAMREVEEIINIQQKKIGLIVLDSIAALVGDDFEDRRGTVLGGVASALGRVTSISRAAALVINQVRFKPGSYQAVPSMMHGGGGGGGGGLAPALGVGWAVCVRTQLMLKKLPSEMVPTGGGGGGGALPTFVTRRSCSVLYSPHIPAGAGTPNNGREPAVSPQQQFASSVASWETSFEMHITGKGMHCVDLS